AFSALITEHTDNTLYHFRIVAKHTATPSPYTTLIRSLKTLPIAPTVKTEPASAVSQTSATLNATVNPNGLEVTECKFEYGTTTSYGSSAPCTPTPGSGTSAVVVSASISNLTANTTYHF